MSNDDLYIIAHKVRGERAFDVAIPLVTESDEIWWIIPTSGHRAYPYWHAPLDGLGRGSDYGFYLNYVGDPPADLRDHYAANDILKRPAAKAAVPSLEDI